MRETGEGSFVAPWSEVAADLRRRTETFEEFRSSGERFTAEVLAILREGAPPPEPRDFLRTFANAVAFKPIFDPSAFVRSFVLEPESLDVARIRQSVENWRRLLETIEELEARTKHLARIVERYETFAETTVSAAFDELTAASADLRRRILDWTTARDKLGETAERLRIARDSVRTSQGFVREIEAEIAEKKALISGNAAQSRLAAADAGLGLIARERRDLAARVAALVGIVQDAAKLSAVGATLRVIDAEAARLVIDCGRAGLRRDAAPDEALLLDGPLGRLLDGVAALPDIASGLENVAEELGLQARTHEREAQLLSAELAVGHASAARLSADTMAFRDELARIGIEAVPICALAEITDPT